MVLQTTIVHPGNVARGKKRNATAMWPCLKENLTLVHTDGYRYT